MADLNSFASPAPMRARALHHGRAGLSGVSLFMLLTTFFSAGSAAFASQSAVMASRARPLADPVALAEHYEDGESVPRDLREARALYCQAASRGDPRAFLHLGWMYLNGRGVGRDDAIAVMWLRKAAGRGVPQAQNLLKLLPGVRPSPMRGCSDDPIGVTLVRPPRPPPAIRALAEQTAQQVGVNAHLLMSVMAVESGFNPHAISPKMAAGLMQLMPATAARFGVRDRFDARENVRGGATYLRSLLEMFNGNLTLALAAYNAGERRVISHGGVPPYRETINYVAAVRRICHCGK